MSLLEALAEQTQAALLATRFLTRFHYKAEPLDAKMSAEIFDHYFDALDPDRLFFTQADIDRFKPQREKLGDAIYAQDLSVPYAIFNLYEQRVGERTAYAREQLKQGFDFSKDEIYRYEREKAPWAAERGRSQRHLAQAREERLVAPEDRPARMTPRSATPSTSATRTTWTACIS